MWLIKKKNCQWCLAASGTLSCSLLLGLFIQPVDHYYEYFLSPTSSHITWHSLHSYVHNSIENPSISFSQLVSATSCICCVSAPILSCLLVSSVLSEAVHGVYTITHPQLRGVLPQQALICRIEGLKGGWGGVQVVSMT